MELQTWLKVNNIVYQQEGSIYTIDQKQYYHIHHKQDIIFDSEFNLIISEQELFRMNENNITDVVFYFGSKWYYCDYQNTQLNLLKYLGKSSLYDDTLDCFLGVHGKYELLNGTRDYNDWCKKALFTGYKSLGICEKHTLAGSFTFQKDCLKNNIKPIIGETLTVIKDEYKYDVKLYVINNLGWKNLLKLHHIHNILNHKKPHITESDLVQYGNDLYVVICTDTDILNIDNQILNLKTYYQLDFSEFISDTKDKERLLNIQQYFQNLQIEPILISDAYYLDSEDYKTKIILNEIGKAGFQNLSKNQYLKHFSEIVDQSQSLFKDDDFFADILSIAINNANKLHSECDFIIKKDQSYLPQYIMNYGELSQFTSNSDLFYSLIEKGFEKKVINKNLDFDKYQQRLSYEIEVLEKGNVIDYFLILSDIICFCKSQGILTGIGRGSAAGSLVAYLLNIVEVDPISYDLLFERFLNPTRLLKGVLPDIDQDVPSKHRGEIIEYIINKYGEDNVVGIGTAQALKLKSLTKDLLKYGGENFQDANKISMLLPRDIEFGSSIELFKISNTSPFLKQKLNAHHEIIETVDLLLNQPRSFGKHAAGIVITADRNSQGEKTPTNDLIPLRIDQGINITEWEKDILEANGFLKLDLLGLSQLDKIMEISNLIKQNKDIDIDILQTPLDDNKTFALFQKGLNEDVFQFGAMGLKEYCKKLKPDSIHDLIAAVALYRPGAMGSKSHLRYVDIKHGVEEPKFYRGAEQILASTYSVMIYQEQVMKICTDLAGFSLQEADDIRKAISKKDLNLLHGFKNKFFENIIEISQYTHQEAEDLWKDIEYFGEYSFNRSHAVCYATTGYYTQYLKAHYPIEFYTVALGHGDEYSLNNIVGEIKLNADLILKQPDINKSSSSFTSIVEERSIYWGLSSVKYLGSKGMEGILRERENGQFYSVEEFLQRCSSFCNKRVVTNLIFSGAFDEIYSVNKASDRIDILSKTMDSESLHELVKKHKLTTNMSFMSLQKDICGFNPIDFDSLNQIHHCRDISTLQPSSSELRVCGLVEEIKPFNTSRGEACNIVLSQGTSKIRCVMWNDVYVRNKASLQKDQIAVVPIFVKKDLKTDRVQMQVSNQSNITILQ